MILKVMRAQRDEFGRHSVSHHQVESEVEIQVRGGALFITELEPNPALAGRRTRQLRVIAHGEWVEAWTENEQ